MSFHVVERTRTSTKCRKIKNARAKRAKILFFIVKYANLWRSRCRRRRGCLSSLMTTATARKTLLENKHLPNREYCANVLSSLHAIMLAKHTTTRLVSAPLNQIQRIKDVRLHAQVVIKTVNVVISCCCFAEDSTYLFIRASHTCSTLIFYYWTNQIYRCRSLRRC